ncbi:oligosaccharide flippase family protein [Lacticigenium naphthae]|uniref:oligosaccharide flippase family protein n=1 Tax=Lacticigenium naphthae TaxID=515351 RepID=UPI00040527E6|nr:oligosaccharide flippase family protein [Lacticigenium naphthae]
MNDKVINFIKNFSYTISSNLISLIISTVVVLIVPKLIGIEDYGYWQLYLFYASYVGFLHFGWNDGIYLRYGGDEYTDLDKKLFFSQFYMLILTQIIIAIVLYTIAQISNLDSNRAYILQMTGICLLFTNVRHMLLLILQATNRIREYAQVTMIGRLLYFLIIILFLLIGIRDFKLMIVADLIGRVISLLLAMYFCKDIVFRKISSFYFSFKEMFENINVGIKLMFANIAGMLIIGVVRFGIERSWDVETFGKVSLTLSASNLMLLFINAVGIIMFPILRRTEKNKLPGIYFVMRDFLMVLLLGLLVGYYPMKTLLSVWLPKYSESLMYMALVFPVFIYEGKMALLINTYLKTLRQEKLMLKINLISVSLSLLFTTLTTNVFRNLDMAILSIVVLLVIRSILAEFSLAKILNISLLRDILLELSMTIVFILSGWYINSWITVFIYGAAYIFYLIIKKKDLSETISSLKMLVKN